MPISEAATVRPYIPPPDESLDAAWERAKLSAPPDSPHLSRAAAVFIISLALAVIIAALVYNFRQDIGALIIDVGQRVSGRSERPVTSPEPAPQTGAGGQTPSATDSAVAGSATGPAQPGVVDSNSPVEAQPAPQPSTASERPAVSPPETNTKPASNKPAATSAKSSKPSSLTSPAKDKGIASASRAVSATTKPVEQPPDPSATPLEAGSGLEEFNIARNILQGNNRRSELQTAIALLWSAVRKGNVSAEVTLADLYRRGEGVEKNCDQAQVLLVAASRKGSPDARRMLEIMAEQGCQ